MQEYITVHELKLLTLELGYYVSQVKQRHLILNDLQDGQENGWWRTIAADLHLLGPEFILEIFKKLFHTYGSVRAHPFVKQFTNRVIDENRIQDPLKTTLLTLTDKLLREESFLNIKFGRLPPIGMQAFGRLVNRPDEMQAIETRFEQGARLLLLYGKSGSGKTSLAEQVVRTMWPRGTNIRILRRPPVSQSPVLDPSHLLDLLIQLPDMETEAVQEVMQRARTQAEKEFQIADGEALTEAQREIIHQKGYAAGMRRLYQVLENNDYIPLLFVFDNFQPDDVPAIKTFLTELPSDTKTLVTSRQPSTEIPDSILIPGFSTNEAIALFRLIVSESLVIPSDVLERLVGELGDVVGYRPQILAQAFSVIKDAIGTRRSRVEPNESVFFRAVTDYIARVRAEASELINIENLEERIQQAVHLINISSLTIDENETLQILAQFPVAEAPFTTSLVYFRTHSYVEGADLKAELASKQALLDTLADKFLIVPLQSQSQDKHYRLHAGVKSLLQSVYDMPILTSLIQTCLAYAQYSVDQYSQDKKTLHETLEILMPTIRWLMNEIKNTRSAAWPWDLIDNLGLVLWEADQFFLARGHLKEGQDLYELAMIAADRADNLLHRARHFGNQGILYFERRNAQDALEYLERAQADITDIEADTDTSYEVRDLRNLKSRMSNNRGIILYHKGDWEEAKAELNQALELAHSLLETDSILLWAAIAVNRMRVSQNISGFTPSKRSYSSNETDEIAKLFRNTFALKDASEEANPDLSPRHLLTNLATLPSLQGQARVDLLMTFAKFQLIMGQIKSTRELDTAKTYLQEALSLFENIASKQTPLEEAQYLNTRGELQLLLDQKTEALASFEAAQTLLRPAVKRQNSALRWFYRAKTSLADYYADYANERSHEDEPPNEDIAQYRQTATQIYNEVLAALGEQPIEQRALILHGLGNLSLDTGQWDEALKNYEKARLVAEALGNDFRRGMHLTGIAEARLKKTLQTNPTHRADFAACEEAIYASLAVNETRSYMQSLWSDYDILGQLAEHYQKLIASPETPAEERAKLIESAIKANEKLVAVATALKESDGKTAYEEQLKNLRTQRESL